VVKVEVSVVKVKRLKVILYDAKSLEGAEERALQLAKEKPSWGKETEYFVEWSTPV
jgi:hypothetical protein